MKKYGILLLSFILLLSLTACGEGETTPTGNGSDKAPTTSTTTSSQKEEKEDSLDLGALYQEALDGAAKVENLENTEWKYQVNHSKYGPRAQVTITNYLGTSPSVVIPDTIDGYPVTKLANNIDVFASNMDMEDITDITFPNTLYFITGDMLNKTAWYQNQPDGIVYAGKLLYKYKGTMENETDVIVADGTVGICGSAFSCQRGLRELVMPDTVVHLGARAFESCQNLKKLRLSNELRYIGTWVLKNNSQITELYVSKKMYKFAQSFGDSSVSIIHYEGNESEWSALCKRSRMTDEITVRYEQKMAK